MFARYLSGQVVPIKIWRENESELEPECLTQIINASQLPFAFHHVALMPDAHSGYTVPIGSVIALKNVICPSMVGVDIGCGMRATRTNVLVADLDTTKIKQIMGLIRSRIPVGFNHHKTAQAWEGFNRAPEHLEVIKNELTSSRKQIGTLGGGKLIASRPETTLKFEY